MYLWAQEPITISVLVYQVNGYIYSVEMVHDADRSLRWNSQVFP